MSHFKTRGIVLHLVNYGDTSIIAKIFTEDFGLQSYMVKGIRKKNHRISPGLFQHLSLLELEVTHKESSQIQHIKEVRSAYPFQKIPFDVIRSSIALFINEVIYKSLKDNDPHEGLFGFLFTTIQLLDVSTETHACFPQWFCLQLARNLGFLPLNNYSAELNIFDLQEGVFVGRKPMHQYFVEEPYSRAIFTLSGLPHESLDQFSMTSEKRKKLLSLILEYYQLHLQGFKEVKSHEVLEKVLSGN